ncbi:hypothetical protein FJZ18_03620 [Candidatus Pacearchaeota archaeon]|nr:hypothetical protein [Candidatus Pacearchaeota archaeon]
MKILPRANWPQTNVSVRVVQLVLGDSIHGDPYLIFEDPVYLPSISTHDEILGNTLKNLGIDYSMEESLSPGRGSFQILARSGEGYSCLGMGFANILRERSINFQGHSIHYALGVSIPHLVRMAGLEKDWKFFYSGSPLKSFI